MSSPSLSTLGSSNWHEIATLGSSFDSLNTFVDELHRSHEGFTRLHETHQTLEHLTQKLVKDLEELKA